MSTGSYSLRSDTTIPFHYLQDSRGDYSMSEHPAPPVSRAELHIPSPSLPPMSTAWILAVQKWDYYVGQHESIFFSGPRLKDCAEDVLL